MAVESLLPSLYKTERTLRALHAEITELPAEQLYPALESHGRAALAAIEEDREEASLRLTRLATLLGTGPTAEPAASKRVDLLIDIVNCDLPEARLTAGEVLQGLAEDRFKEVALGVERALERLPADAPALIELPYLMAEFADAGAAKLISKFLTHKETEVVAAAIEALAELGDPSAISALKPLEKDGRHVVVEEEDERVTLGTLASEAIAILREAGA